MWNIGTTARLVDSAEAEPHWLLPQVLAIKVALLCMQPLGSPVVPEV
jgi:hypothetical protein